MPAPSAISTMTETIGNFGSWSDQTSLRKRYDCKLFAGRNDIRIRHGYRVKLPPAADTDPIDHFWPSGASLNNHAPPISDALAGIFDVVRVSPVASIHRPLFYVRPLTYDELSQGIPPKLTDASRTLAVG